MGPDEIAFMVVIGPVAAAWVCGGIWMCAILLRLAYDALKGDI